MPGQRFLPTIDDAIANVEARIVGHRAEAHGGSGGFFDCAACGALEHRLDGLRGHKARGGRFIPVKGLSVDAATGEMTVLRIDGSTGRGVEVDQRITAALRLYGLSS